MKYYKLTYCGKATSITIHGAHFRKGRDIYMTREEMPFAPEDAKTYDLSVEEVEADERPENTTQNLDDAATGTIGVVWDGMSQRKTNDWGTFVKGVPRFDVPTDAVRHLAGKPGWARVER